jgi:3-hydroxyacyl-CoA dehydrogenase
MGDHVIYGVRNAVAVLTLNGPPVNALGQAMRRALQRHLEDAIADDSVEAIVITSSGKVFSAGADIGEFAEGGFAAEPYLPGLLDQIEASPKLVVAAINGAAFGGGLETALACHYRFVAPEAQMGFPEVNLGILPGAGGTQRLPRLVGAPTALGMITTGRPVSAHAARKSGLVDELHVGTEDFVSAAIRFARLLLQEGAPLRSYDRLSVDISKLPEGYLQLFRASIADRTRGFFAPERCIQAVEAACTLPFREGLKREAELFHECLRTPQARAQQHLFFAERDCGTVPDLPKEIRPRPVKLVGIVGAGTMGGGIAMAFVDAGIPVRLLEKDALSLERGIAAIRGNYESRIKRGRLTAEQVEERMTLVQGTLFFDDLGDADVVIEAAFEKMALKKEIFATLEWICKPGAILATDTSSLDLNEIAAATARPQDVIGLHFFSPAQAMRLIEIVRGAKTAPDVVATALNVAKKIRKVGVVVGVCFGFASNRMLEPYLREAHRLVLEGASPEQVDRVLTDFGMAMGVFSMCDLAGNDVGFQIRDSRRDEFRHDPSYFLIGDRLHQMGRYGQKSGKGFYRYNGRNRIVDPEVDALAEELAASLGIRRRAIDDVEILERCIYSMIKEGAEILSEGVALRSGDLDVIWCHGLGFPVYRGGPMHYADEVGIDRIIEGIRRYRGRLGEYGAMWFTPPMLLEKLASEGKKLRDFRKRP